MAGVGRVQIKFLITKEALGFDVYRKPFSVPLTTTESSGL